jgi:hypothetical protein
VPYLRADHIHVKLGRQIESEHPMALSIGRVDSRASTLLVGGKAQLDIPVYSGTLSPNLRLEYRRRSWSAYSQKVGYSDTPLDQFDLREESGSDDQLSASAGISFRLNGVDLNAEYGTSAHTTKAFDGGQVRLRTSIGF